jgi:hypothetical protein
VSDHWDRLNANAPARLAHLCANQERRSGVDDCVSIDVFRRLRVVHASTNASPVELTEYTHRC